MEGYTLIGWKEKDYRSEVVLDVDATYYTCFNKKKGTFIETEASDRKEWDGWREHEWLLSERTESIEGTVVFPFEYVNFRG